MSNEPCLFFIALFITLASVVIVSILIGRTVEKDKQEENDE